MSRSPTWHASWGLRERLQLLQELLGTISSSDDVENDSKRSIFELKGVGAEMWREIDVDEYFDRNATRWMGRESNGSKYLKRATGRG